jgi:uncharacterized protein with HEPN domain
LQDIIDNAAWIAADLEGVGWAQFERERMRADAVERCLQRITEAVIHIGEDETARVGLAVPWAELRNLGNRLRHEYGRLDRRVIYDIATMDVPRLAAAAAQATDY